VLWQWGLTEPDALVLEARFGIDTIDSGETLKGAARFASGAGRHGTPVDEPFGGEGR
jgi:enoyl-CoA hydratase